ncbi:DNRLRE domain-containing protein [Myxococcus xanthus]|uniref:DNRLRE domain-containing protein n=1 Tax=Myxococcus xanthus TaxID=34 RepID=UPI001164AD7A|nr:hypothetical protein BHS07_10355 [Myxococcus xanthus]
MEPVADSQVTSSAPDTNYGQYSAWEVNRQYSHVYMRFDLSLLPPNIRVRSVRLSVTANTVVAHRGDGNAYTTYVPDDDWHERTITWNNKPAGSGDTRGERNLWYGDTTEAEKMGVNSIDE